MSESTMTAAPELMRVARSFTLILPDYVGGTDRLWLRPGSIIDVSDPFVKFATSGQTHKLEPLTPAEAETATPTPYSIKMLENARTAWLKKNAPALVPDEKPTPKPKGAAGIQKPDPRPTKPAA
jgi:hypothetical protein